MGADGRGKALTVTFWKILKIQWYCFYTPLIWLFEPHVDFALDLIRIVYFFHRSLMIVFSVFGEMSQELDNWGDMHIPFLDSESEGWE